MTNSVISTKVGDGEITLVSEQNVQALQNDQEWPMGFTDDEQAIIDQALSILEKSYKREDLLATSPEAVKSYCQLQIAASEREIFGVLLLDNKNQLIESKELFMGGLNSCEVQVREIIKAGLRVNCGSIIAFHNHPSGDVSESVADVQITKRLQEALEIFGVKLLDHIIVSPIGTTSFAERGLL